MSTIGSIGPLDEVSESSATESHTIMSTVEDKYVDIEIGRPPSAREQRQPPGAVVASGNGRRRAAAAAGVTFSRNVVSEIWECPAIHREDLPALFYTRAECRRFRREVERELEQHRMLMDLALEEREGGAGGGWRAAGETTMAALRPVAVGADDTSVDGVGATARKDADEEEEVDDFFSGLLLPISTMTDAHDEFRQKREAMAMPALTWRAQAMQALGVMSVVICYGSGILDKILSTS